MKTWTVAFAEDVADDLALIEEHLYESYRSFGEADSEARRHAEGRIDKIITDAERLAAAPLRGSAHDELMLGLRHLTLDRAIFWYRCIAQDHQVQVLAVFFGAQDHQRRMLVRLLQRLA